MEPESDLLRRVCETLDGYLALGNEIIDGDSVRFVRRRDAWRIYDANRGTRVRATTCHAIDSVLEGAEQVFQGIGHRAFSCDRLTPAAFEARLLQEGYVPDADLQLLLEGELRGSAPTIEIRVAQSDSDWDAITRLTRLDFAELARKFGRPPHADETQLQMVASRRAKAPELRQWLARVDGVDCGYFSSWPGENGIGKVEDLFTHPDFRGRGVATALIARAVADARARGAGPVVIAARPDDTPKRMYAAMGFRPFCVTRSYVKQIDVE